MSNPASISCPYQLLDGLPRFDSLVHMFRAAVEQSPDRVAVIREDRQITYREFGRAAEGLRRLLAARGVAGERVALLMPNTIEADVSLMAVMAAHAQVAPINPFFQENELAKIIPVAAAKAIICDAGTREKAQNLARDYDIDEVIVLGPGGQTIDDWIADDSLDSSPDQLPGEDDLALLIFSGGSTGIPKGVNHTHSALLWSVYQHATVWPLDFGNEVFLNVAPMFHIWGLGYSTFVPIYSQCTLVMVPRYDPDKLVQAFSDHHVTVFAGGPAPIYMGMLTSPLIDEADFSTLKYCCSGGAPCPEDLHREWLERTGCRLYEGWGMTEGAPMCINSAQIEPKLLSVGVPVPETDIEVVDLEEGTRVLPRGEAGEVRARGPQIMLGYRNNPEETARTLRDGWVYTGDIGYVDDDGYVCLVDRKKDMIIVGGFNVYPRDVDEILFSHPKIREAAVVGKPDSRLGEVIAAFVVVDQGQSMDDEEFFSYCSDSMVKYKRPVEVHFVDSLPKTGTNKISRPELRQLLSEREAG